MKKLSIVSKDYDSDEHVVGCYTTGERMKRRGAGGAFILVAHGTAVPGAESLEMRGASRWRSV